jgi:amino-acid N-acetyltransferase
MNGFVSRLPTGAIEGARSSELTHIQWLLNLHSLPTADITEDVLKHFLVYRDAVGIAGVVGLECYGDVALLRSLAVADGYVGLGIGKRLVAAAEELARARQVRSIYLLTTTAQAYFEPLGFRCVLRDGAPSVIAHSSQFKSLCPSTAVLMVKP